MAVIVKYIVVRDGEEKMTFATKKEADAYDKMLDIADRLFDFLESSGIELDEDRQEEICLLMAQRREEIMPILKGLAPKKKSAPKKTVESPDAAGDAPPPKAAAPKTAPKKAPGQAAKSPAKPAAKPKLIAK